jgi:hypothetical protein
MQKTLDSLSGAELKQLIGKRVRYRHSWREVTLLSVSSKGDCFVRHDNSTKVVPAKAAELEEIPLVEKVGG